MSHPNHVALFVEFHNGKPFRENVHVKHLDADRYRLLHSPGFVQGIAAGDEFRLLDEIGRFEVTHRSGNLVIQVFSDEPVVSFEPELTEQVNALGGWRDGGIERGVVFSIPVDVGFSAVEQLFDGLASRWAVAGFTWVYGNVYDPVDGITPLNWWS